MHQRKKIDKFLYDLWKQSIFQIYQLFSSFYFSEPLKVLEMASLEIFIKKIQ